MAETDEHGVALVERVIAKVRAGGFGVFGERARKPQPVPARALASLSFPDGSPLSPSVRRWLAFDGAWLGWFKDVSRPVFRPAKLGRFTTQAYREDWGFGAEESIVGGDCFGVPFGSG